MNVTKATFKGKYKYLTLPAISESYTWNVRIRRICKLNMNS